MVNVNQELAQAVAEANKPMAEVLTRIERSMRALASVELARTLYSRTELRSLLADYQQLIDADTAAYEASTKTHERKEQRESEAFADLKEPQIGELSNGGQLLFAARKASLDRVSEFKELHPVVAELHAAKKYRPS